MHAHGRKPRLPTKLRAQAAPPYGTSGARCASLRNFVPYSDYARQVYLPLSPISSYWLRQLLALKLPNVCKKRIKKDALRAKKKKKRQSANKSRLTIKQTQLFSQCILKTFVRQHCNFRRVRVPFRRWLPRTDRARGVLLYASGLTARGNAASTVL